MQSKEYATNGMIDSARSHGMYAAYLDVAAIAAALLVAVIATGLVIGLIYY